MLDLRHTPRRPEPGAAALLPGVLAFNACRSSVSLMPPPRADLTSLLLRLHALSARQREVAELLLSGPRTDQIAAHLCISPHTLRDHVKAIFANLGVKAGLN